MYINLISPNCEFVMQNSPFGANWKNDYEKRKSKSTLYN